jgi:D-3-phosphoglycerate dehydrogenase
LTETTQSLIDAVALAKMKDGARLVNCARGGIVDEAALRDALERGKLAGAALDVFATEPLPEDDPLRTTPNLVLTPHLGASTAEAQVKVAEAVAEQVVAYFKEGKIMNAVNVGVALTSEMAPFADLAGRLGRMLSQLVDAPPEHVRCVVSGRLAEEDVGGLTVAALQGLLMNWHDTDVNMVNAPLVAEERGIEITEEKTTRGAGYTNLVRLVVTTAKGEHAIAGTVFEGREPRVVEIDGYAMDIRPRGPILIMTYPDRPGMVGKFGTLLGDAGINIAGMDVGRKEKHGTACVALTLDDTVPRPVLDQVRAATAGGEVTLVDV